MTIQRMENVGTVVDDLEPAIGFFVDLGLELTRATQPRPEKPHHPAGTMMTATNARRS